MHKKRGQGFTSGNVLAWILGIVVVVLVALVAWNFFGVVDQSALLPEEKIIAASVCEQSIGLLKQNGYCNDFKELEIGGKKQYVNCAWLKQNGVEMDVELSSYTCDLGLAKKKCEELRDNQVLKWDEKKVNGDVCKDLVAEEMDGEGRTVWIKSEDDSCKKEENSFKSLSESVFETEEMCVGT